MKYILILLPLLLFATICHASDPYWHGYDDAQDGYWKRSDDSEYLAGYEHGENGVDDEEKQEVTPPVHSPKPSAKKRSAHQKLVLKANGSGGYYTQGEINGKAVHFVVDTGATYVSLSKATANKLRLKYSKTKPRKMQTASGVDRVYLTTIKTISIGDIVLHDVSAAISTHDFPKYALLGMSFLGQLDMIQNNNEITLIKK